MKYSVMEASDAVSSLHHEMNNFYCSADRMDLVSPQITELKEHQKRFYRVLKLSYDEDYPRREAFENVLLALDDPAFNFVYILSGNAKGMELCIGVVENEEACKSGLSAGDYGRILCNAFEGNFGGSELVQLRGEALRHFLHEQPKQYRSAGIITGIPTINGNDSETEYDFQGIDRLINSMLGLEWRLVVVCKPVTKERILRLREELYEIYNRLSLFSRITMQSSRNSGSSSTRGSSVSDSRGKNKGWSESDSAGESWNDNKKNKSKQIGKQGGTSEDHSESESRSSSVNQGRNDSMTVEVTNKRIQETLTYLDDELLERMKSGFSKGMYNTAVYYMAENKAAADRLKSCMMSLFQGDRATYSPLMAHSLSEKQILGL